MDANIRVLLHLDCAVVHGLEIGLQSRCTMGYGALNKNQFCKVVQIHMVHHTQLLSRKETDIIHIAMGGGGGVGGAWVQKVLRLAK